MTLKTSIPLAVAMACVISAATGCGRDTGPLAPWPLGTDPIVFQDNFTGAVIFQAFGNSKLDALSTDTREQYEGTGCLRITVPNPGAGYAGGAFTTVRARDLSGYNALTFWAKASKAVTLDVAGLGNDNTGTSKFEARRNRVPLTTTWTRYVIPIPLPGRLTSERGLFFFAGAPQGGSGYDVWIDDVKFESVGSISTPRPAMTQQVLTSFVGATLNVTGTKVTFDVGGTDSVVVEHMPGYFTYESSDSAVATVAGGLIRVVGEGTTAITARLGTTPAAGAVILNAAPFTPGLAPTPTVPAGNVISLFSNAYASVPVDKWSADWDNADVADLSIFGNDMKVYKLLPPYYYAGIEFTSHPVDATAMDYFHLDVLVPTGTTFTIKLVDFGADGRFGGTGENRDSEHPLTFNASSTPQLVNGSWISFEIPLSDFMDNTAGLRSRAHLAQLIIQGDMQTVYVDNAYFHK